MHMFKFLLSSLSFLVFSYPAMASNNSTCHYRENLNAGNVQRSIIGPLMVYTALNIAMNSSSSNYTNKNNKLNEIKNNSKKSKNQQKHTNNFEFNYDYASNNNELKREKNNFLKRKIKKGEFLKNENQKKLSLKELIEKKRKEGEKLTREELLEEKEIIKLERAHSKKLTKIQGKTEKKKKNESLNFVSSHKSDPFDFRINSIMKKCKTTENIFHHAVQFSNKKIEGFSKEESEKAAELFFAQVFKNALAGNDKGNYFGRSAYTLGNLYYDRKNYQRASKFWLIAESQGINVKENLEKLKKEVHLPEKNNLQKEIELMIKQIDEEISKVTKEYEEKGITVKKDQREKIKEKVLKKHLFETYGVSSLEELKQKGMTKVITRGDTDNFTYEKLKNKKFTAKEIDDSLFSSKTLKENDRVAKELHKHLDKKTLSVFIGRSVEWILEHYKRLYPESPYLHLPGSGLYNINRLDSDYKQITPEEAIEGYKRFVAFKLKDFFETKKYSSITLIDRTESGDSIFALMSLLNELNPSLELEYDKQIKVIGIVTKGFGAKFKFPKIEVDDLAIKETVKKHGLDQAKTLSRSFDPLNWEKWETFDFYPEPLAPAKIRLKQIENYYDGWE